MSRPYKLHIYMHASFFFVNVSLTGVQAKACSGQLSFSAQSAVAMKHPLIQIGGVLLIRNIPKIVLVVTIFIALKSSVMKLIEQSMTRESSYGWNVLG